MSNKKRTNSFFKVENGPYHKDVNYGEAAHKKNDAVEMRHSKCSFLQQEKQDAPYNPGEDADPSQSAFYGPGEDADLPQGASNGPGKDADPSTLSEL